MATALGAPRPAFADVLNSYVTVTCDGGANRAMVRFGHAGNNDPPEFLPLPGAAALDLSRAGVATQVPPDRLHQRTQEASCRLPDGREVKVRFGLGPVEAGKVSSLIMPIFSVWIGKSKVLSRQRPDVADCQECLIHSVLLEQRLATRCDFRLPFGGDPYALSSSQIACRAPMPFTGAYDALEYPRASKSTPPQEGSLQVEAGADRRVCRALIVGDKISLMNVGGEFPPLPLSDLIRPTSSGFYVVPARAAFENDGRQKRLYRLSAHSRYFDGDMLFVTSELVPQTEVIALIADALALGGDLETLPTQARRRGWTAYSGSDTPYDAPRYVNLTPFRFRGAQYLLADSGSFDPAAVVLKPGPKGRFKRSCVLQRVRPNF